MGGLSIWHWLIVLVIVALVFGTKRLRKIGEDVGAAIRSLRKGMQEGDGDSQAQGLATLQGPGHGPEVTTVLQQSAVPVPHGCGAACSDLERVCLAKCQDNVGCQDGCTRDRAVCMGGCY